MDFRPVEQGEYKGGEPHSLRTHVLITDAYALVSFPDA